MNPYLDLIAAHIVVLGYLLWYVGWQLWRCSETEDLSSDPSVSALQEHLEAVRTLEARATEKTMEAKLKLLGVK